VFSVENFGLPSTVMGVDHSRGSMIRFEKGLVW
jgi:hypothetical protein